MLAFQKVLPGYWLLGVMIGLASDAKGQDVVPGGWMSDVGFQSFSAPIASGGFAAFSYGNPVLAPMMFGGGGAPGGMTPSGFHQSGPAGVTIGLIPLTNAVKRHTRRRTTR